MFSCINVVKICDFSVMASSPHEVELSWHDFSHQCPNKGRVIYHYVHVIMQVKENKLVLHVFKRNVLWPSSGSLFVTMLPEYVKQRLFYDLNKKANKQK